MVSINRSKAGRLNDEPLINTPLDNSYMGKLQNNVFQNIIFSKGFLDRRIRYINQSVHDISIIDGVGMVHNIPYDQSKAENRLVICVNYTWGNDVHVDVAAILKHWPGVDKKYIDSVINSIRNTESSIPCELDLYFTVDLSDIDSDPYGLWIEQLNVQVVTRNRNRDTTFFTRDCFFNRNDELYEKEQIVWTTTTTAAYFVNDRKITESIYLPLAFDLLEVKPVYAPEMPMGLHVNLRGNVTFSSRRDNRKSLYIRPDDFKDYGIYSSIRAWKDAVRDSTKGMSKEEAAERLHCFEKFHKHWSDDNVPPLNIRDVVLFKNVTIGSVVDLLGELAKADAFLDKLFKKK